MFLNYWLEEVVCNNSSDASPKLGVSRAAWISLQSVRQCYSEQKGLWDGIITFAFLMLCFFEEKKMFLNKDL